MKRTITLAKALSCTINTSTGPTGYLRLQMQLEWAMTYHDSSFNIPTFIDQSLAPTAHSFLPTALLRMQSLGIWVPLLKTINLLWRRGREGSIVGKYAGLFANSRLWILSDSWSRGEDGTVGLEDFLTFYRESGWVCVSLGFGLFFKPARNRLFFGHWVYFPFTPP